MKKVLSAILVMAILLTSAVSVFATDDYGIKCNSGNEYFLRNDGALYRWFNKELKLVDTDIVMVDDKGYHKTDYKHEIAKQTGISLNDIPEITHFIYLQPFGYDDYREYYASSDGNIYELECFNDKYTFKQHATVGKVVEVSEHFFITEDNSLYLRGDGYYPSITFPKIADDVVDFKETDYQVAIYRTSNNDLYLYENHETKFLLSNCSKWYSYAQYAYGFAKTNDGKWYHMGNNSGFVFEPEKMVDGNNITPERFDTMVQASQYIYKCSYKSGVYEWALDGNLYYYEKNKGVEEKQLIAEGVIALFDQGAVTSGGDVIVFHPLVNTPYSFDCNIKDMHNFIEFPFVSENKYIIDLSDDWDQIITIKLGEKYPNRSDWADAEIALADEIGYINSVKLFDMQSNIKREDFCNMIVDFCEKYLGRELSTTSNPFADTENEKVIKAYANGIITGISYDTFAPDNNITREQMCAIMTRATKVLNPDVQFGEGIKFSDMHLVSDWAVEGVNAMSGLGIVKGDGVSITPKSNTSVEQAIAMTYRLYNKIK